MDVRVFIIFMLCTLFRIWAVFVSRRNERRMKQAGAVEFSRCNSRCMRILHYAFYCGVFIEGMVRRAPFDGLSALGSGLLLLSIVVMVYVIRQLAPYWTVKVILAPGHVMKDNWLIRMVRHPNYFLNIIPELMGLVFLMKAYWTVLAIFPIYAVCLSIRIREEERVFQPLAQKTRV